MVPAVDLLGEKPHRDCGDDQRQDEREELEEGSHLGLVEIEEVLEEEKAGHDEERGDDDVGDGRVEIRHQLLLHDREGFAAPHPGHRPRGHQLLLYMQLLYRYAFHDSFAPPAVSSLNTRSRLLCSCIISYRTQLLPLIILKIAGLTSTAPPAVTCRRGQLGIGRLVHPRHAVDLQQLSLQPPEVAARNADHDPHPAAAADCRRSVLSSATMEPPVDDDDPVAGGLHLRQYVGREDDRFLPAYLANEVPYLYDLVRVEPARGLVQDEDLRVVDHRLG